MLFLIFIAHRDNIFSRISVKIIRGANTKEREQLFEYLRFKLDWSFVENDIAIKTRGTFSHYHLYDYNN